MYGSLIEGQSCDVCGETNVRDAGAEAFPAVGGVVKLSCDNCGNSWTRTQKYMDDRAKAAEALQKAFEDQLKKNPRDPDGRKISDCPGRLTETEKEFKARIKRRDEEGAADETDEETEGQPSSDS